MLKFDLIPPFAFFDRFAPGPRTPGVFGGGYSTGLDCETPAGDTDSFFAFAGLPLAVGAPAWMRAGCLVARITLTELGSVGGTVATVGRIGRIGAGVGFAVMVLSMLVDCEKKMGGQRYRRGGWSTEWSRVLLVTTTDTYRDVLRRNLHLRATLVRGRYKGSGIDQGAWLSCDSCGSSHIRLALGSQLLCEARLELLNLVPELLDRVIALMRTIGQGELCET